MHIEGVLDVEETDNLREKTVTRSDCEGPNALTLFRRVASSTMLFASGVNIRNRGRRDSDDLLSCPH